jgi:glycosyltransferase involved in cell wall biosynthesis
MSRCSVSRAAGHGRVSEPLVSVVMNGFNSARYLSEAIASLREQTYERWELVFWDNCSEDESAAIVRACDDPRIRFHCAPRRMSLAEGRNAAIAQAHGDWIAFLDCDDLWTPDKLTKQFERLAGDDGDDVGLIYCRTRSFSARGDEGDTTYLYAGRPLPEGNILRSLLLEGNLVPIVSAMISRQAYEATGGIPIRFTFAEDYWLFVAIAARFRALCVQDVCCHYRIHEESATYRDKLTSHREALQVLEEWVWALTPQELRARQAVYHTLAAMELLRRPGCRVEGLAELFQQGSLRFLARGTARHAYRRYVLGLRPYA